MKSVALSVSRNVCFPNPSTASTFTLAFSRKDASICYFMQCHEQHDKRMPWILSFFFEYIPCVCAPLFFSLDIGANWDTYGTQQPLLQIVLVFVIGKYAGCRSRLLQKGDFPPNLPSKVDIVCPILRQPALLSQPFRCFLTFSDSAISERIKGGIHYCQARARRSKRSLSEAHFLLFEAQYFIVSISLLTRIQQITPHSEKASLEGRE